tara:strand:+ start:8641 stop:10416 length:1776 start_codon:yes stop_codon:yes gene_type:complete
MAFKDDPIVYLLGKFWKYSALNRGKVILYFALLLVANLISLAEPLVVAWLLNTIQEQGVHSGNIYLILGILSIFVLQTVAFWAFHGPGRVIETKNAFIVKANYKKYLLDGTMDLPAKWHTDHHSGDTIDKIEKGTNAMFSFSESSFELMSLFVKFIGSYIALIYFNLHATYIVAFMMIIAFSTILKFDKILKKNYRKLNKNENEIAAKIFDTISNITTVIILRIENLLSKEVWKKIMRPFNLYMKTSKINEVKWFMVSFFTALMTFFVLGSFVYLSYSKGETILIGTLYALYSYVGRISETFFHFGWFYSHLVRQKTRVENSEELAKDFEEKKKIKNVDLGVGWKNLTIKNLRFSYHDKKQDLHLDNVSLRFRKGEKIALIGESGGGKTTFLKLMRGLYEPRHVEIYLGWKKIEGGFKAIEENITLIPQDPEIFATTIKGNITMGVSHNEDYIEKFTDMARFTEVVRRLPKGLKSSVVEKGVNLSGGEKQRLALARGLMACEDKQIILLDEPTSSVDAKNELQIYKNILTGYKDRTIISTIHKLNLLHYFDTIYMFKGGKIVAGGSFDELLDSSRDFRSLWKKYKRSGKLK